MTIDMLQNARNWAAKHQKFACFSHPDPMKCPLLKFLGTPLYDAAVDAERTGRLADSHTEILLADAWLIEYSFI